VNDEIRSFFDLRAGRWDDIAVHPRERVDRVLDLLGHISGRSVLDVGSGTGVLVAPLLDRVGPGGKVVALDIAPRMIEVSRRKYVAPNLEFVVADFLEWLAPAKVHLVIAYSCFPHFLDPGAFWAAARRCLAPGGRVLVAHIEGREAINALHGEGHDAVSRPLGPIAELSDLARDYGFVTEYGEDSDEYFLLLARLEP
jgi:ubiquinone/menaquinone biosynthesis C-methylase UbiE